MTGGIGSTCGWSLTGLTPTTTTSTPLAGPPAARCGTSPWPRSRSSARASTRTRSSTVALPRLARHTITLPDGHTVGVAVCGRGVPLVVVHGFSAEGILYAQTLSRLVDLGFKVIAVDTAGHGGTLGLPTGAQSLSQLRRPPGSGPRPPRGGAGGAGRPLHGRAAGHRAGGAASPTGPSPSCSSTPSWATPGTAWSTSSGCSRRCWWAPALTLVVDTITTVPWFRDPRQALKLGRLVAPTLRGHVRRPVAAHGSSGLDPAQPQLPLDARPPARGADPGVRRPRQPGPRRPPGHGQGRGPPGTGRPRGGGGRQPLLAAQGPRDAARDHARPHAGSSRARPCSRCSSNGASIPLDATDDEVEAALYAPDALVLELTPREGFHDTEELHRPPRFQWTVIPARGPTD